MGRHPRDIARFAQQFAVTVVDGFGSSRRHQDRPRGYPEGSLEPPAESWGSSMSRPGPARPAWSAGESPRSSRFRGYY